jgi:Skp family chaperone for outer membrane proteins
MKEYKHLNQETIDILFSSKDDKLFYLESPIFIDYPRTKELMQIFEQMMKTPKRPRMPNLLLIGEPNIGKTSILNKFYNKYSSEELEDENGYIVRRGTDEYSYQGPEKYMINNNYTVYHNIKYYDNIFKFLEKYDTKKEILNILKENVTVINAFNLYKKYNDIFIKFFDEYSFKDHLPDRDTIIVNNKVIDINEEKEDKRHPGVIMEMSKSEVIWDIVRLIRLKVITYDDLSDFSDELQLEVMIQKEENIRTTLNEKAKKLDADAKEFQRKLENNGFATRERAEQEQMRLMKQQQELQALQQKLSDELASENQKNSLQLRDSINSFLKIYNQNKGYDLIISNTGFDNLLYANPAYNITQEIIDGLNARYTPSSVKK